MNCNQVQVMLAAHRELKSGNIDTTELGLHVERCSACREVLAYSSFVGEQVRTLHPIKPSPDMYTKLMRALAAEHTQFIQRSTTPLPPPEFLKPYLREHSYSTYTTDPLAAFSSADTGPLPMLHKTPAKRHGPRMGQFAVIGLAALVLITLMMGGITSLLLLAHDQLVPAPLTIYPPTNVVKVAYTTNTPYRHVVSAVADREAIYYTAYGDGTNDGWMLERLDRNTKISTPLLNTTSASPLVILGSSNDWLIWLQFDVHKYTITEGNIPLHPLHSALSSWSLHYLPLSNQQHRNASLHPEPMTLLSGTFTQEAIPSWVYTPVQGIWFIQNTVLVAMVDEHSIPHLLSYQLDPRGTFTSREIASASPSHIFTSPTANSDGSQIYWAEEWRTDDEVLHSNIWTQQVLDTPGPSHGHLGHHTRVEKELFRQDGMSFRPEVVDESLFLLSNANSTDLSQVTTSTTPTAISGLAPIATPNTSSPLNSWADASVFTAPLDAIMHGTLLMFPLDGDPNAAPSQMSAIGSASSLQAGTDFVLWQSGDGYAMYDAVTKTTVTVGDVLNNAQFLAINGNAAVWTVDNSIDAANSAKPSATLMTFNWPRK